MSLDLRVCTSVRQFIIYYAKFYDFRAISFPIFYCPSTVISIKKALPHLTYLSHNQQDKLGFNSDCLYVYFNQFGELPDVPSYCQTNHDVQHGRFYSNIIIDFAYSVSLFKLSSTQVNGFPLIGSLSKTLPSYSGAIVTNLPDGFFHVYKDESYAYEYPPTWLSICLSCLYKQLNSGLVFLFRLLIVSILGIKYDPNTQENFVLYRIKSTTSFDSQVLSYLADYEYKKSLLEKALSSNNITYFPKNSQANLKCRYLRIHLSFRSI